jgi:predicted nucleotidyltransferase
MFDSKQELIKRHKAKHQEELLEIFILIEENTMQTKVQALTRYARLFGMTDKIKANEEMKKAYSEFNTK